MYRSISIEINGILENWLEISEKSTANLISCLLSQLKIFIKLIMM
jgi:hypothetical protein